MGFKLHVIAGLTRNLNNLEILKQVQYDGAFERLFRAFDLLCIRAFAPYFRFHLSVFFVQFH